jgi:malonyl CoA-acyl carrier protein transacylase
VRWSASVSRMVEGGADRFLELGPGRVLATLNRRNARDARTTYAGEPEDFSGLEI